MNETIHVRQFDNGLVLVAEPMPWLGSVACSFRVPGGYQYDPPDRLGTAELTCEMVFRGAGNRDSQALIGHLDSLGAQYGESVGTAGAQFGVALLAQSLPEVLPLYADVLRRPWLPEEKLEQAREVVLQEVRAVEDEPAHKVLQELRRLYYPDPLGRPSHGTLESVPRITLEDVRQFHGRFYQPQGAIFGVAGQFDWDQLQRLVEQHFGDWSGEVLPELELQSPGERYRHFEQDSQQTHVAVAFPTVPYRHNDYFPAAVAASVLGRGMSSRLFTQVRERRGLCYAVWASYHTLRDQAAVLCYAGTTADRAQQTLDVMTEQIHHLAQGITSEELQRVKAQVKSRLVMQQESSSSRAGTLVGDYYHLGRVRSLAEVQQRMDRLTLQEVNRYLAENPPRVTTVVTLGPSPLEVNLAVP